MSFSGKHSRIEKFNQLWVMMPSYPGFAEFYKPYSHVTQLSGMERNALEHVMVRVVGAILSNPLASESIPFTED